MKWTLSKEKLSEFGRRFLQVGTSQKVQASALLAMSNLLECPSRFEVTLDGNRLLLSGASVPLRGGLCVQRIEEAIGERV